MRKRNLLPLLLLTTLALSARAQVSENLARGFEPEKVYQVGDVDNVNVFNGNLIVDIPIGPTFPVGGQLKYGFHLVYNGNPWDFEVINQMARAMPSRFNNVAIGWQLTMGELVGPNDTLSTSLEENGNWLYAGPDGSEHPFFPVLHHEEEGNSTYAAPAQPGVNQVAGYTRDSSYLRLMRIADGYDAPGTYAAGECRKNYRIDFPDGTRHYFESLDPCDNANDPSGLNSRYRIYRIDDQYGNFVKITYNADDPTLETVTDSTGRQHTIYHWNNSAFYDYAGTWQSRNLVNQVTLAGPQGQTSTYYFDVEAPTTISLPCGDTTILADPTTGLRTAEVPFLRYVQRPDGTRYSMQAADGTLYYSALLSSGDCSSAHIQRIDFPTGGRVQYTPVTIRFPFIPDLTGDPAKNPDGGRDRSSYTFATTSIGVGERDLFTDTTSTTPTASWTYHHSLANPVKICQSGANQCREIPQEEIVTVTDPAQRTTAHYFSVFRQELDGISNSYDTCFQNGSWQEYGLPFTHRVSSGPFNLSTESFDGPCTISVNSAQECPLIDCGGLPVKQRSYVIYDTDSVLTTMPEHWDPRSNSRLQSTRTEYPVSGGDPVVTDVVGSDFDGLGHYRTQRTSSTISTAVGSTPSRWVTTHYNANPQAGTYPGSTPDQYMIFPANLWLTGVYNYVDTTQDPTVVRNPPDPTDPTQNQHTARQEFTFDARGFLSRHRTLANGTSESCSDLLAAFTDDGFGNVIQEAYYGGDIHTLGGSGTCSTPSLTTADYTILNTYQYGALKSSKFLGTDFYTADYTIDPNTGLIVASRDTAGSETDYFYNTMYRIWKQVEPSGGSLTKITYVPSPLEVTVDRCAASDSTCGSPITQYRFYYDGLGRMTQSKTKMPGGQWSLSKKVLDGLGRVVTAYQPEYRSDDSFDSSTPAYWTSNTYNDYLGRLTNTQLPDGNTVTQQYTGVWETKVTTGGRVVTDTYDGDGRLVAVEEASAPSGGTTITAYRYDVANRLIQVESSTQRRKFRYDDRGFLLGETHPELSAEKTYSSYDSRGHAHHSAIGGAAPLDYTFDAAERVSTVSAGSSLLKEFHYGTYGAPFYKGGRLDYAIRHNTVNDTSVYPLITPKDVAVKDDYQYDAPGRIAAKTTTLSESGSPDQVLPQTYTRDALGNATDLIYPTVGYAPSLHLVYGYENGLLRSVGQTPGLSFTGNSTSTYITYHPTGMVNQVPHGGYDGTTDVITPDHNMARPADIKFQGFASCTVVRPDVYVNTTICPGSTTTASVAEADATTYSWQITGGTVVSGANTNYLTFLANTSGSVTLTLTLTNSCGTGTFQVGPIPIATSTGTLTAQGQSPTTLSVALSGAPPYTLNWSDGYQQFNVTTSTATHTVSPTVTTAYYVTISDANSCTNNSNSVTVNVTAISAPASVTATATTANQVQVNWPAVAGATSYVVFRDNVQVGTPTTNSFTDNGVTANTAYLYKVHAKSSASESGDSPVDLATTVIFNTDPYRRIRAFDITSLRAAVNAVRVRGGIGAYTFTDSDASLPNHFIRGIYFQELRTKLNEGRQALGLPQLTFTDPDVNPATNGGQLFPIKQIYVNELRAGVQ